MKYHKWRESNELHVGVTWHISFHISVYFRNTWLYILSLFMNLLSERHILSPKLTNAQMNGWMNKYEWPTGHCDSLKGLYLSTLVVWFCTLMFIGQFFFFFFLLFNFLSPLKRKNHFTGTLTPCPLCYGHNKEMRLMDALCCHQSLFHECPARLSPVMTQEESNVICKLQFLEFTFAREIVT